MKIFTINPGSTSTKIALFEDDNCIFSKTVSHDAEKLAEFEEISEQLPYRKEMIMNLLEEAGQTLNGIDAFVGRCGGLFPIEAGTYEVTDLLLFHIQEGVTAVKHPARLGAQLANAFTKEYGGKAYIVNPPDVDELQDVARMTGIKGVYRRVHLHTLNLKETAIRHANSMGRNYDDCNFVVCHIGGGISISAHCKGKMIDGYDIVGGEGPMAPTRCGSISVSDVLTYIKEHDLEEVKKLCTKSGGFVNHVGISDALELTKRAENGDKYAEMLWNTMIYQICKGIGSMACVLEGKIDGILLGGGMVYNKDLVEKIVKACRWIAPVTAYPGEFEMEAMAAGARRVLLGEETVKIYTGKPVWDGFDFA